MTAAACAEGPPPDVTFADLPREHQGEMVRLALVAAASTAYFVVLAILSAPLPSRSLVGGATLPHPAPVRSAALEARLQRVAADTDDDTEPPPPRTSRPRPADALAALSEPAGVRPAISSSPRRNPFSRFFRGVLHTVAPD